MADLWSGVTPAHAFAAHVHQDLAQGIERIHASARVVGRIAPADWVDSVVDVLDWTDTVLRPHAAWEDAWLYPEITRRTGSRWPTELMTFEHRQILAIARQLEPARDLLGREPFRDEADDIRGHLFALEALLRAHIEREEQFLLPLLDTTVDDAARQARASAPDAPFERRSTSGGRSAKGPTSWPTPPSRRWGTAAATAHSDAQPRPTGRRRTSVGPDHRS